MHGSYKVPRPWPNLCNNSVVQKFSSPCRKNATGFLLMTSRTHIWIDSGLGLSVYRVHFQQDSVTYSDFVNKELVQFAKYDETLATLIFKAETTSTSEYQTGTRLINLELFVFDARSSGRFRHSLMASSLFKERSCGQPSSAT